MEYWFREFVIAPLVQAFLIFLGWRFLLRESMRESLIFGVSIGFVLGLYVPSVHLRPWPWRRGVFFVLAVVASIASAVLLKLLLPQF